MPDELLYAGQFDCGQASNRIRYILAVIGISGFYTV
jgi:hypothetical protein